MTFLIVDVWQYLYMLYNIMCGAMHPLYGALPAPYVPVGVTRSAFVAHRYTYTPPCCRTSQYCITLFSSQCLCGTIFPTLHSMVCDWRVSRTGQYFFIVYYRYLFVYYRFHFLFFLSLGWYCEDWGLWTHRV